MNKPIEQLLAELEGREYHAPENDVSSDALEDELESFIRKAQARQELIEKVGDAAYDYDDPEEILENSARQVSNEHLASTGLDQYGTPTYSKEFEKLEHVFENMSPEMADQIPQEHKRALIDPRTLIDEPIDLTKTQQVAKKQKITRSPSFVWNTQKLLAAEFRAQGYSAERIARFTQAKLEDINEWLDNRIFQSRVNAIIENGPQLAIELGKAHAPLAMRKLIALWMSGTDAHKTQVQALAQYFKILGMDGRQAARRGVESDKRVDDAFKFIEGVAYTIDGEMDEMVYDSAVETVDRDLAASGIASFMQAKDIARQEDQKPARTGQSHPTGVNAVPDRQTIELVRRGEAAVSPDIMLDFVRQLDATDWDEFESQVVYTMANDITENVEELTPEQLAELRLDQHHDDIFAEFLKQKIRESTWIPILKLDPAISTKLKEKNTEKKRRYWTRRRAKMNGDMTMNLIR